MCSIRDAVHITKGNCIMTDTIINVSSLSFGYAGSDVLVLEDITFDINVTISFNELNLTFPYQTQCFLNR